MPPQDEVTVLVHGIWMQGFMMIVMEKRLRALGFLTAAFSYDFLNQTPAANAQDLHRRIGELGARRVNLVGHSLGGIVILNFLDQFPDVSIGKVVLIGSPVRGSVVAKHVHENPILRPFLGKSADGLLEGAPRFKGRMPLGIITGSGRLGLLSLLYSVGRHGDGVVQANETLIDTATDRINVPYSHSGLIFSRKCADYVGTFLMLARFRI